MLLTVENTKGKKVSVHDVMGHKIPCVVEFDTDTCEVKMLVYLVQEAGMEHRPILLSQGPDGKAQAHVVSTRLSGAYAIVDGQKV